jgi:hypothetical protein
MATPGLIEDMYHLRAGPSRFSAARGKRELYTIVDTGAKSLHVQENLLLDCIDAFNKPRWFGPKITLSVLFREIVYLEQGHIPEDDSALEITEEALSACEWLLPPPIWLEWERQYGVTVSPGLNIELQVTVQSPVLQERLPLGIVRHDATTHRLDISDEKRWLRHFEYIKCPRDLPALVEGTRGILMDTDDDEDSDFVSDSDETSSSASSESGISDSFSRSPTPF